jgi:hypothetical protein
LIRYGSFKLLVYVGHFRQAFPWRGSLGAPSIATHARLDFLHIDSYCLLPRNQMRVYPPYCTAIRTYILFIAGLRARTRWRRFVVRQTRQRRRDNDTAQTAVTPPSICAIGSCNKKSFYLHTYSVGNFSMNTQPFDGLRRSAREDRTT